MLKEVTGEATFTHPERQGSHPPFVLIILHNRFDMTWRMWPEISATRKKDKAGSQHGLFSSFASILKWLMHSMCKMLTCYVLFFRSCAGFFRAVWLLRGTNEINCYSDRWNKL